MSRARSLYAVAITMTFVTVAAAALPTYSDIQLQARASFSNGFNLPTGSQFPNAVPAINDGRALTFAFVDLNMDLVMWQGQGGVGGALSQPFYFASNPTLNTAGDVAWRASSLDGHPDDGVWRAVNGVPAKLTIGPTGATSWGEPQINDNGLIMYRARVYGAYLHVVYDPVSNAFTIVAGESPSTFYFLATPAFNNADQVASEAWDATLGNRIQLRRWELDGSSVVLLDDTSHYREFLNTIALNDAGQIAYQGVRDTSGTDIGRVDDDGFVVIAATTSAGGQFTSLPTWGPALNNAGIVAFRGVRSGDTEAVWIGDGTDLRRVAGVGDVVQTDLGPATITGLSASPDINNRGDVAFNAALSLVGGGSIGRGIFIALAAPSVCRGDGNCDGVINWRDIDYFVAAMNDNVAAWEALFAPGTPACDFANNDVDADGTVNWRDIDPLVAVMNTVCP